MCDQGRLDFHWVNSDKRLTSPLVKDGSKHRVVDWTTAGKAVTEKLQALAPSQIALIASGRMTNEELFLARRLAYALKISPENIDIVPRTGDGDNYLVHTDRNPNTQGAKLTLTATPGGQLQGIRERVQSGQIRGVIALRENLLNAGFSAEALSGLAVLVQTHVMTNQCAELAHVVLPSAADSEKRGSMVNDTGRLQRLSPATQPPGDARDDWEILRDLILQLSGQNGLYSIDDVFAAMASEINVFSGLTLAKIGEQGVSLVTTGETVPLLERERVKKAQGLIVG